MKYIKQHFPEAHHWVEPDLDPDCLIINNLSSLGVPKDEGNAIISYLKLVIL